MPTFLKCKRCGRRLTDPESQTLGYGPICFLLIKKDKIKQCDLFSFTR